MIKTAYRNLLWLVGIKSTDLKFNLNTFRSGSSPQRFKIAKINTYSVINQMFLHTILDIV